MTQRTYFGTDSVDHAQDVMPRLKQAWGLYPSWHARYVCAPTASYNTDKVELAYMHALGQRVAFVFDGRAGSGYDLTDEAAGRADATIAMAVIRELCPGRKPLLMDDIESNQTVSLAHFKGWSGKLRDEDWPGGYYIPISQDVYSQVYGQLVPLIPRKYRLIWTAQWYNPEFIPPPGTEWNPRMGAGIVDPGAVVMHQYNGEVPGLGVDTNLALPEAYEYMLSPEPVKPAYPRPAVVTTPGSLKTQASHGSGVSIDPRRKEVWLEVGSDLLITGPVTRTDDEWLPVNLIRPESMVHGWYLRRNLAEPAP